MPDDVVLDEAPERRVADRSWLWLLVVVLVVAIAAASVTYAIAHAGHGPTGAFATAFTDDFDRFDTPRLGFAPGGARWVEVDGSWSVQSKAARVTPAANPGRIAIALGGSVRYGAIQAQVTGMDRCGLVARYVGPGSFVALERIPEFAVWNLLSVVDGNETVLARLDDVKDSAVVVRLETGQRVVTASVRDHSVTVILPTKLSAAPVGLMGRGTGPLQCAWGAVWAGNGR
jgi:hypothetical protein